ncbi:hypothetical protein [Aeoliella sp.]|uniref:hypothetical protein n=1 Tax=Aeoliella sp. TaxID=2795800 RepID=UPI003CCBD78C
MPLLHRRSQLGHRPYTGYNYNTSYIGHGDESIPQPAKLRQIQTLSKTAIFGDGQYAAGAE